jgi:hypothetical protein
MLTFQHILGNGHDIFADNFEFLRETGNMVL